MRKIFFAAIISLVTVICVSATIAEVNAADNYSSSVTANIAGVAGDVDFDTRTLVIIYNMMPQNLKDLCIASYKDIAPKMVVFQFVCLGRNLQFKDYPNLRFIFLPATSSCVRGNRRTRGEPFGRAPRSVRSVAAGGRIFRLRCLS